MEVKIKIEKEVNVKFLKVSAGVRYWEDAELNGVEDVNGEIPCRNGDRWEPLIDLETGRIINWDEGNTAFIHYKVCDDGIYILQDEKKQNIVKKESYVPNFLAIDDDGFGDYIIMQINNKGFIKNWKVDFEELKFFEY